MSSTQPGLSDKPIKVRRRWWNRPVCWIKRGHLYRGQPFVVLGAEHDPYLNWASAVVGQACARCGKERRYMGVDR